MQKGGIKVLIVILVILIIIAGGVLAYKIMQDKNEEQTISGEQENVATTVEKKKFKYIRETIDQLLL